MPTNPSARDRKALQTTVAHKITARIVKTSNGGVRTITSSRRASNGSSDHSFYSSSSSLSSPVRNGTSSIVSRKRVYANSNNHGSGKRAKICRKIISGTSTPSGKQINPSEEMETLEKRNLHNDMERQRRIGLKNLFENLKDKIPSIREKERAPKVNILREATTLCNQLTREEQEYEALKRRQMRLVQRLKQLRSSMAAMRGSQ